MNKLVQTPRGNTPSSPLALLITAYQAEFEIMCIQFLSGGWKLAVRDSVMALCLAREEATAEVREQLEDLLVTDGEAMHALLQLAQARGPAQLQVYDAQLQRLRRRHSRLAFQLRRRLGAHNT